MGGNGSESQPKIRLTSKPSESARPRLWHRPRLTLCGVICYALIGCAASVGITISGGTLDAAGVRSRVTRTPDTSRVPTMEVRSFPPLFECRGHKRFHRTFRSLALHKGKQELTAASPSLHVSREGAATEQAQRPSQIARRQPGKCYADALRSPPREVELAQNRGRDEVGDTQNGGGGVQNAEDFNESGANSAVGPRVFDVGDEESDEEHQEEDAAGKDTGPNTPKKLMARIRNLESKKDRRLRKLRKQQQAVDKQNEYIEEQHRVLNTLIFEVADTREDIVDIDHPIDEASKLHAELSSARVAAHGHDEEEEGGEEEEHQVAVIVQQVISSMRAHGKLRANALQKLLTSLMQEAHALRAAGLPHAEQRVGTGAKRGRTPSRSPAPRTPPTAIQPPPLQSSTLVVLPQEEPTVQMRQQAQAALASDAMWEVDVVQTKVDDAIAAAAVAASSVAPRVGPVLPPPHKKPLQIPQKGSSSALAICDRPSSEPRGRWTTGCSQSPARSRDRKDLYKELNERVVQQRQAAYRGRAP